MSAAKTKLTGTEERERKESIRRLTNMSDKGERCYVILGPHKTIQRGSISTYSKEHAWDTFLHHLGGEPEEMQKLRKELKEEGYRAVEVVVTIAKD